MDFYSAILPLYLAIILRMEISKEPLINAKEVTKQ